jgi:hypothetical protein
MNDGKRSGSAFAQLGLIDDDHTVWQQRLYPYAYSKLSLEGQGIITKLEKDYITSL